MAARGAGAAGRARCGASACSCAWPRTMRKGRPASRRSLQGLQQLGWTDGRNVRIDIRLGHEQCRPSQTRGGIGRARAGRHPGHWQRDGRALAAGDPHRADRVRDRRRSGRRGFVESLARPGGNATGFTPFEYGIGAKWLELLKEIAPSVTRAAVLRDPAIASGLGQFGSDPGRGAIARGERDTRSTCAIADEIERAITAFARVPNMAA